MRRMRRGGFTLVELMVALVVAGILMASLVALSTSVRRSFGRTKEIIDLQANLRFAMKTLVDDFSRASYMTSPDPARDGCRVLGNAASTPAIELQTLAGNNFQVTLRGNYVSSRDFLMRVDSSTQGTLLCRNQMAYDNVVQCRQETSEETDDYELPLGKASSLAEQANFNQRMFGFLFCNGADIRIDVRDGFYMTNAVRAPDANNLSFQLNNPIDRNRVPGNELWINPITSVTYSLQLDNNYQSVYGNTHSNNFRWVLQRGEQNCGGLQVRELADFLLPPGTAAPAGFHLEVYRDTNAANAGSFCAQPQPVDVTTIGRPGQVINPGDLDPLTARAVVITLRGRTEHEDPDYHPGFYNDNFAPAKNFALDLDGYPESGMAHVRVERAVVELPNLADRIGVD